jgi:hypothetical protein
MELIIRASIGMGRIKIRKTSVRLADCQREICSRNTSHKTKNCNPTAEFLMWMRTKREAVLVC